MFIIEYSSSTSYIKYNLLNKIKSNNSSSVENDGESVGAGSGGGGDVSNSSGDLSFSNNNNNNNTDSDDSNRNRNRNQIQINKSADSLSSSLSRLHSSQNLDDDHSHDDDDLLSDEYVIDSDAIRQDLPTSSAPLSPRSTFGTDTKSDIPVPRFIIFNQALNRSSSPTSPIFLSVPSTLSSSPPSTTITITPTPTTIPLPPPLLDIQQQEQQLQQQQQQLPIQEKIINNNNNNNLDDFEYTLEERLRFKELLYLELNSIDLAAGGESNIAGLSANNTNDNSRKRPEIYGFCECTLLHNHLNIANLIITSENLCFLPKQLAPKGYFLESYLQMKGDFFWKKYWFVLSHDSISWYRTSEAKETFYPNGTIPLRKITSIQKLPRENASRPFCFEIVTNSHMYLFQAESEIQLNHWCSEISRIQRNLTVILPFSDIVTIEMESDAALFFDAIYMTTKRGEKYIVTPSINSIDIYKLMLNVWHLSTSKINEKRPLSTSTALRHIEFQKIFRLTQRPNIINVKTCLLFNDDISLEGNIYLTVDGLYFNSDDSHDDAVVLIIPILDIISICIDTKSDSPEAIKVVTEDYEVFNFDLIEEYDDFFDQIVEAFTKTKPTLAYSKLDNIPLSTDKPLKKDSSRWRTLKSFLPTIPLPKSIPISIPIGMFKSKSSAQLTSPNNNNNNNNTTNVNSLAKISSSNSTSSSNLSSSPVNSNSLSSSSGIAANQEHDKTIFIQKNLQPNMISMLHKDFPALPMNEPIISHQTCTLFYYSTDTFIEGQIFITKSYIAFSPTNSNNKEEQSNNMKALIPFEDVIGIKKERSVVFFKPCIKVITSDHKWIFGSITNFYSLFKLLLDIWHTSTAQHEQGIFTPLESVRIRENLGLPNDEPLITWFNCTNFRGAQLKYGILYLTKHFICFRSKFGIKRRIIVIPFSSVTDIQRHTVLLPNGLKITTNQQDIEFASFLKRGQVYDKLMKLWRQNQASETPTLYKSNGMPKLDLMSISSPQIASATGSPVILSPIPAKLLKVTILTIGSRGDIQPFLALAIALKNFGHSVTLASHELYRNMIENDFGLKFAPLSGDPKELMDLCVRNGIFTPKFIREALSKFRQFIDDLLQSCWLAAQGAEALIATPGCFAGPHIAEALQIPFFHSFTMPFTRTRMYPNPFAPFASTQMGGVFNLATHIMMEKILWQPVSGQINAWRSETLKLPVWSSSVSINETYRLPYLYCFSKHLVPKPPDWGDEICLTGHWFLPETNDHPAPDSLIEFLNKGSPPIYIGFGSIVIEDPNSLSELIVEAMKLTKRRAIISQGWGGLKLSGEANPDIYLQEQPISHSWLFERVSMVIHHGGAGTTSQGILSGKPTIIVPFFGDQFFWGERVKELGIGKTLSSKTLSAKSLSSAILSLIDDPDVDTKVKLMSKKFQDENGVKNALDNFHRYLPVAHIPPLKQPYGSVTSCTNCKQTFGLLNQMVPLLQTRFNCNHCGKVFCEKCTASKIAIPKFRISNQVRVCDSCYSTIQNDQQIKE
ncbi:sterol glucosyltransferase [Heterostelium album PN500]|uniref:sterol 3beta-glucosyltransferase n=1 Tax=Heterostelium pallidum (strain ATCC 26659 / Pp 5 / PN500) TaxID=670386 RepID=D3BA88_HETP5|nr:sterol glucosyltransferase [Heterostelium album PN500]EFA81475.1 sterol glucosyltransferase [Heterostelium album PN500]|eukprot:XP_020433593.1 sterol glucosyltransferase [Heterostelium album PN500]